MTDRRLLKVLPGGRPNSKHGPDGEAGQRPGQHGHYADPYAAPEDRSPADPAGARDQPGPCPDSHDGPHRRGRARLRLLPPAADSERQLPPRPLGMLPVPAPQPLDWLAADAMLLLAPGPPPQDADSPANGTTQRPDTTIGPAPGQDGRDSHAPDVPGRDGHASGRDSRDFGDGREVASRGCTAAAGRHRRPGQQNAGDPELLAEREIRALWAAQLLSSAGNQFARVAIAVLVYGQTRSPLITAVAYALTYLPPLPFGRAVTWLTGAGRTGARRTGARLTMRLDRRTLMIGLDVARAALVAAMTLPGSSVWSLCALLSAAMLLGSPFSAARAELIRDHAPDGLSRMAGPSPAVGTIGYQAGQALGFLAGAGLVAALQPRRTLLIDALTFLASACLVTALVRRRRPQHRDRTTSARPAIAPGHGASAVARSTVLRTLALLGWLAGFYVVPECLAAPYAHALKGGTLVVGLLMAAMPAGAALGVLALTWLIRPPAQAQLLGWLAMLSCVPLIFSALHPPLGVLLALWALAGLGTAYQAGAAVAFISDDAAVTGLGFAQAGLVAAQCLGFVAAGAAAQVLGPQAAVALAGLSGLGASAAVARMWRRARIGRTGSGTLARAGAGPGAMSAGC
jgi:hypothetical protein